MIPTKEKQLIKCMTDCLKMRRTSTGDSYRKFISIVKQKAGYNSITQEFEESNESSNVVAEIKFTGRYFPIQAKNLACLFHQNWIGDEVVNFVGAILEQQSDTVKFFSSYFFSMLFANRDVYEYHGVRNWWKKVPTSVRHLYIPINIKNVHWIFLRLDFQSKSIQLWDSIRDSSDNDGARALWNQKYLIAAKKFVRDVKRLILDTNLQHKKMWGGKWTSIDESKNSPIQTNSYDCGSFIILSMALLIHGGNNLTESSYSQQDMYDINVRDLIMQLIYSCKV